MPKTKLWFCSTQFELVIASESQPSHIDILEAAIEAFRNDDILNMKTSVKKEVRDLADLPENWDSVCIPYGDLHSGTIDRTVGDILDLSAFAGRETF